MSARLNVERLETREVMDAQPVLLVIANQDFFYREYNDTRNSLLAAGVPVVVAATTTNASTPHANSGQGAGSGIVTPDIALANVDPADYSAIAFVGGWGSSQYQYAFNDPDLDGDTDNSYTNAYYNGDNNLNDGIMAPTKVVVNNLINAFLANNKFVGGVCHGVTVLAWARVDGVSPVAGRNVTVPLKDGSPAMNYNGQFYGNGYVNGQYDQMLANGGLPNSVRGSIAVHVTTTDDVVVDGRIITGSDDFSAAYFGQVIAQQVLAAANQAPTDMTLSANSLNENQPVGTIVGTLATSDPNNGDTFTYALVNGDGSTDNAKFNMVGNSLRSAQSFDAEDQTSLSIRLRATDQGGLSVEKSFLINITNVNEAPTQLTLSNNVLAENEPMASVVGIFSSSDPDLGDTLTYSLVAGDGSADNAMFSIVGNTLRTTQSLNYEAVNAFQIRVRTTDAGGLTHEQEFMVNVANVNEAPTTITLSNQQIAEGEAIGTVVGLLSATDPDQGDTATFSLVAGEGDSGNTSFTLVGNQLQTAAVFDRTVQDSYSIRVQVADANGLTHQHVLSISISDVNDPPLIHTTPNLVLAQMRRNPSVWPAIPVSAFLEHASDAETPETLGIAITGKVGLEGTWEYANSEHGPWQLLWLVADNAARLLSAEMFVRFKPNKNSVGHAGLSFRVWDGQTGSAGSSMDTLNNGATFSTAKETAWVTVGTNAYNDAGEWLWPAMNEDQTGSKVLVARSLVGHLAYEFPAKTALGLAVTETGGNGVWQIRVGRTWEPFGLTDESNPRLLQPTQQIRFVPNADWNGEARLQYRVWNPANGTMSTDQGTACLVVNAVNDPPLLDTTLPRVFGESPLPVSDLLAGSADIDSTVVGIAIPRIASRGGRWAYRVDPFSPWVTMTNVSMRRSLILDPWAEIRFVLDANVTQALAFFDYKAVDDSAPVVSGSYRTSTSNAFSKAIETATFAFGNHQPMFNAGAVPTFGSMFTHRRPPSFLVGRVLGRMSDVDVATKRGLALTSFTGEGTWDYSLDGGRTWGAISDLGKALLLRATDRLRFTPNTGWTGTASITFAAWDQTLGTAGDYFTPTNAISAEELTATLVVK